MFRSFIPFILASLGFTLISWTTKMPLFEWQFNEIVPDFSSACNGTLPSHWTTRFGEDLEARNKPSLLENLNFVISRSWTDASLDHLSLSLYNGRPLLFIGVMLSIIYMWWYLLQDKQDRVSHAVIAVIFTAFAVGICILLSQVVRLGGPAVGQVPYYYEIWDCHGTITFSARLLKVHYETLIVLLAGILSVIGALVVMLHHIRIAMSEQKKIG